MIIKSFEVEKINHKETKNYLFYGDNDALKNEILQKKFKTHFQNKIYLYDENDVLKDEKSFFDSILTNSFFEKEKLIIISRITDKSADIAKEIVDRKLEDLVMIFIAEKLEKKSKIRNFFEKDQRTICVPFYPDNYNSLSKITNNFFNKIKVPVSREIINKIVERSNGNRQSLKNELDKIENFTSNKKNISLEEIIKLTNLSENNTISELIDFCLAKNQKKTSNILNENNFTNDDNILIIRTFLGKIKRLIKLKKEMETNQNIDTVINLFKPAIFWKDKEIVKQQLKIWEMNKIEELLYNLNKVELSIKKNYDNSLRILLNFIFNTCKLN